MAPLTKEARLVIRTMPTPQLRALIHTEREQGRANGPIAEEARITLGVRGIKA